MSCWTYTYTTLWYGDFHVATFPGVLFDDDPFIVARVKRFVREHPALAARTDGVSACQTWSSFAPCKKIEEVPDFE